MVRIGRFNRGKSEISREDDSDEMSDFSSSQFTFTLNQNADGINQNMEYMMNKEDSFRQSVSSSKGFFCFPKCGSRYIKCAIQFSFLLSSTAIIFIIVFFVSIAVMDSIFRNKVISSIDNVNLDSVPNIAISEPTSKPTSHITFLPTLLITNDKMLVSDGPSLIPSQNPIFKPSSQPSMSKSFTPSNAKLINANIAPSVSPSFLPHLLITNEPSDLTSSSPSISPTYRPSAHHSSPPTVQLKAGSSETSTAPPSNAPYTLSSNKNSANDSTTPTLLITTISTNQPSAHHSSRPIVSLTTEPSDTISRIPLKFPTPHPTITKSSPPTVDQSAKPTVTLTTEPSEKVSRTPSKFPTLYPTVTKSSFPTDRETNKPSFSPTESLPSPNPSMPPTDFPTAFPTKVESKTVFTITSGYVDKKELKKELMNQPDESQFIIHLGNFMNDDEKCNPTTYMKYRDILLSSKLAIPIFMIPGANDLDSSCVAASDSDTTDLKPIDSWESYFHEINTNWVNPFIYTQHSSTTHALFAIFQNDVLFIGLNLLREPRWGDARYITHLNMNLRWIQRQLKNKTVQERGLKSIAFFGNDRLSDDNKPFFENIVKEIDSMNIPAIYIYENESIKSGYPIGNDLLFVGIETSYVPFMSVVIRTDEFKYAFQILMR